MTNLDTERRLLALEASLERLRKVDRTGGSTAWTPFFEGSTGAGSYTYITQQGFYVRVGKRIYFEFDISISAISVAPTGSMMITGLPILSGTSVAYGPVTLGFISNIDLPVSKFAITALVQTGGFNRFFLYVAQDNAGGATYPAASFTNAACELIGGGWYETD